MTFEPEIQQSLRYLASPEALRTIAANPYWPKWDGPWWQMSLLHEMGETKRIPEAMIQEFVASLNRFPVKIFPIHPGDMPAGLDPIGSSPCHCQLGNVYQVLATWGVDVDGELPWIRKWFLRYQMADGGMNCDEAAYLVKDEVPSSMVGTISAFEAVLLHTPRPLTTEEQAFLDLGARFLIGRKLVNGSDTMFNADERVSAAKWVELCFPRFYLYDVLRGLTALLLWAEKTNQRLPRESVREAVAALSARHPGDEVRIERWSGEGVGTIRQAEGGEWLRRLPAGTFPLLEKVRTIGAVSPFLSRQWQDARRRLKDRSPA